MDEDERSRVNKALFQFRQTQAKLEAERQRAMQPMAATMPMDVAPPSVQLMAPEEASVGHGILGLDANLFISPDTLEVR